MSRYGGRNWPVSSLAAASPKKTARTKRDPEMACFTCHLSWTTSCGGCHLPIEANWKTKSHRYEGEFETRNFASYNPQVARDQMFQLGVHQTTKGNQTAPVRSTSALVLSSTNINRERIYVQQPPISAMSASPAKPLRRTSRTRSRLNRDQDLHRLSPLAKQKTTMRSWRSCCCSVRIM